jgi:hypothetical protein
VTDSDSVRVENDAGRLASVTTGRPRMWREAMDAWRTARVAGTGAGSFALSHYRYRQFPGVIRHAHNQWLNVLTELGVVGLLLFAAAVVLLVVAAVGNPLRWRRDPQHPLLVAAQAGGIAFLVHMSVDWDWDITALGVAAFALLAAAVAYRRWRSSTFAPQERPAVSDERPRTRTAYWLPRLQVTAVLALVAVSWALPYLAERSQYAAIDAVADGRAQEALELTTRAARLNPLAAEPLLTQAAALQQLGQVSAARRSLQSATRLQPENYETWYKLGVFQAQVLGKPNAARESLRRALVLNPDDMAIRTELSLLGG